MAGTIDLGEVKLDTRKAKRSLQELDDNLSKVQKNATKGGGFGGEALERTKQSLQSVGKAYQDAAKSAELYADKAKLLGASAGTLVALAAAFTQVSIRAEANQRAIQGLNGAYDQIRSASAGAVSAQQAFAAQNSLTQSGLNATSEQMVTLSRAAREFALRTGTDTTEALTRLTTAIASGDTAALRPFGVSVQNGTLRTQAFRQAMQQLERQHTSNAAPASTLREEFDRLGGSLTRLGDSMASAANQGGGLRSLFREMSDAMDALVDGGPLLQNMFAGLMGSANGTVATALGGTGQFVGNANDRVRSNEQTQRNNAISTLAATRQRFPGLSSTFNPNSLRGADIGTFTSALSGARSQSEAEAIIGQFSRQQSLGPEINRRAAAEEASVQSEWQRMQDREERTVNMSAVDVFGLSEEQRQAVEQLQSTLRGLQSQGVRADPRYVQSMMRLIRGFLVPMNKSRFQQEMARLQGQSTGLTRGGNFTGLEGVQDRYGSGLANEQYLALASADRDKANSQAEMSAMFAPGVAGRLRTSDGSDTVLGRFGGGLTSAQYQALAESEASKRESVLSMNELHRVGAAGYRLTGDGSETIRARYGSGLTTGTYDQLVEAEAGKAEARQTMAGTERELFNRNSLGQQMGSFFSDTQTLAEKGAKGVEGAFNTMSGAVSGFIDTLIEGQVPAGEAAVGLAKAALKGLAMQALPESLFETAKGFASLAGNDAKGAALHFTAAGIFAGVAVAAGAAAAGIGAAQRGATPSASASASASQYTPLGGSSGNSQQGGGTVIFNINSTVFDPERAEETVARLQRGANARGL